MPPLLSKSRYLAGLQCPRLVWTQINQPDRIPRVDSVTQHVFDQGHLVGEHAKLLFPGGIDIAHDSFMKNIFATKRLMAARKALFEAGILSGRTYSRIDILNPVDKDGWEIVEIKSTTSVKDVHIDDVSFQSYCCEQAGLAITSCKLGFINTQYVKDGAIDPQQFFILEDITALVEERRHTMEERILELLEVISGKTCPDAAIGEHCLAPYECGLRTECWGFLPENSVFDLRGGKVMQFCLYRQGIISIKDIPEGTPLSGQQRIQRECVLTGDTHVEKERIRSFLDGLRYPLYYLDFETMAPAIPLYDGMRPYQTIPFQFSLHVVEDGDSEPVHHSFLADGEDDPRPQVLDRLRGLLGSEGSIIAYNAGFEEGALRELVEAFPAYTDWLGGILERFVDLLSPFRSFHYYHASQKDTASLKSVLVAVTGRGYDEMVIGDGMAASAAYARTVCGMATEEEVATTRAALIEYCKRDTEGMVWLVEELRRMADRPES